MKSDEDRAKQMLKQKSKDGRLNYSFLFKSKYQWGWVLYLISLIYLNYSSDKENDFLYGFTWVMIGIFLGRIIRDLAWVRDINDSASFSMKVVDWNKVEEIAKGKKAE